MRDPGRDRRAGREERTSPGRRCARPGRPSAQRAAERSASRRPAAVTGGAARGRRRRWSGPGPDDRDPQPFGPAGLAGVAGPRLVAPADRRHGAGPLAPAGRARTSPTTAPRCPLRDGELVLQAESTAWATQLRTLQRQLLARLAGAVGRTWCAGSGWSGRRARAGGTGRGTSVAAGRVTRTADRARTAASRRHASNQGDVTASQPAVRTPSRRSRPVLSSRVRRSGTRPRGVLAAFLSGAHRYDGGVFRAGPDPPGRRPESGRRRASGGGALVARRQAARGRRRRTPTARRPSPFSKGWRRSASAPACTSAPPVSAACTT